MRHFQAALQAPTGEFSRFQAPEGPSLNFSCSLGLNAVGSSDSSRAALEGEKGFPPGSQLGQRATMLGTFHVPCPGVALELRFLLANDSAVGSTVAHAPPHPRRSLQPPNAARTARAAAQRSSCTLPEPAATARLRSSSLRGPARRARVHLSVCLLLCSFPSRAVTIGRVCQTEDF